LRKQVLEKKLPWADWVDHQREEAEAWADYAEGKHEDAIRLMRKRADAQVSGVFAAQGDLPAREMLADMLLGMKRPEDALREYDALLKINPKRFDSLYGAGQAAEIMKQPEKAASYYRELVAGCANGDSTRPELVHAREVISTVAQK
jgi:tetratricopeptide (TPR) repeat protein